MSLKRIECVYTARDVIILKGQITLHYYISIYYDIIVNDNHSYVGNSIKYNNFKRKNFFLFYCFIQKTPCACVANQNNAIMFMQTLLFTFNIIYFNNDYYDWIKMVGRNIERSIS